MAEQPPQAAAAAITCDDTEIVAKKPSIDTDAILEECTRGERLKGPIPWSEDNPRVSHREIPLFGATENIIDQLPIISVAPKLLDWIESVNPNVVDIANILVKNVVWFGKPDPTKLGFLMLEVDAWTSGVGGKSRALPPIVFLRGNSVAVQIIVDCGGADSFVILTKQVRLAAGRAVYEIPAGMVDSEKNIKGVAIKEVEEETGITIDTTDKLMDLGFFWPSPGACDEQIHLYACTVSVTPEKLEEIKRKVHGVGKYEAIKLELVPLKEYPARLLQIGDAKAEIAYRRWTDKMAAAKAAAKTEAK